LLLQVVGIDEELHAQVEVDLDSPSASAKRPMPLNVVHFDPIEFVLGLGINHAEHRAASVFP